MPAKRAARTPPIPSIPPGVTLTTLDNGLTIIVREDHSAPVVSAQAWAMTGSIHEGRWLGAGLSHVLEHMLFKGTASRGPGKIDQEVHDAGGAMNAYTSFDRTVYHIDVPNTGARVAIAILCDIMQHASLPPDELAKEMDVIRREMDMGQDDPGRRSGRRLFETAYTRSPYRFTIIGYPDIFNELKPADIHGYYRERYAPNNVFLVVVGDVAAADVIAQITAAYRNTRARALPPMVLPLEPAQTAAREVVEEAAVELGHLHLSWHIPDFRHADIPALELLAMLLGSGHSSRLYRRVREELGLAHSADAWTYNPGLPGLFGLSATVDADKFPAACDALRAEVHQLQTRPITRAELGKVVKQVTAATLSTRKTMAGQAQDLGGNWLAASDLNFTQRFLEAVRRVTPADLRRVARQHLTAENSTLYALLPAGTTPCRAVALETLRESPIQKIDLPNGLRLLLKEDHRLPFVQFRAVLRGGVLAETAANNGVSALMSKLLVKGTRTRTADQISTGIESVGGHLDAYAGNNSFGLSAEVLADDFDLGLELVADVLRHPAFPPAPFEREREIQLAGIRAQRDDLLTSCFQSMRQSLFGPRGYGLDSLGDESSLPRLTTADLRALHQQLATPGNCVLAIFGDVRPTAVVAAVRKAFATWKASPALAATRPPKAAATGRKRTPNEPRDKKQAVIVIGFPGGTLLDADRCALDLIQESCSDLGSRLFLRIRERLGLAYYCGAQNFPGLVPGYFAFYAGTAPDQLKQVEREILAEAALLCAEGFTDEELRRAQAKVIGQKKIARQDLGGYATLAALDELYGLGFKHHTDEDARFEAVTREDIRRVANQYLRPGAAVVSVLAPAQ